MAHAQASLLLLQANGLIKLKDPSNIPATKRDIVENPKAKITELEANLAAVLNHTDFFGLINTNYALEAVGADA